MAESFFAGVRRDLLMDRDTELVLTVDAQTGVTLTGPVFEMQRSRVPGSGELAAALVPVPTITSSGDFQVTLTEELTGAWQDLAGVGRVSSFRYRGRASADGGSLRTLIAGYIRIGPIGFAQPVTAVNALVTINTGDVVFGDVDDDDPDDPEDPTYADAIMWDSTNVVEWETDQYATWE